MKNEAISLYYTEGNSDKEYHVDLLEKPDGFVVNFRYGRRGSALKAGTKTAASVPYERAKKVYDKLVAEKLSKGYSTGEAGAAYQSAEMGDRFSGILPQLLNVIREEDLERYLTDPAWCAQEKFDGQRRLIRKGCQFTENEVHGINKKGLIVPLPQAIVETCQKLDSQQFVTDGEQVGERLYAFDVLELNGVDLRALPYSERIHRLKNALPFSANGPVRVVKTAYTTEEKRALLAEVKARSGEGIVFKKLDAPYVSGRPAKGGDQVKFQFRATATCRVELVNQSKRSVLLSLYDERAMFRPVGRVTIPVNYNMPREGYIVEVQYLYAYRGGSLYQPVYLGERSDQDAFDAKMSQLKYKPDGTDEEDEEVLS